MRRWWKSVGLLAGGLVGLGGILSSASAQFPPPGSGGFGMPPGGGMMGPPPGMVQGRPTSMGMPPSAFGGPPDMGGQPAEFPNAGKPSSEPTSPFSLKDEGAPNAFNCDQYPYVPLRFQISAGYVFTWFRGGNFPPLTSTGSVNDQPSGALGQPNTVLLTNGVREPGLSSAFRTSITYWLKDPEVYSLDADFFIMEQRTLAKRYESDGAGVPLLARPYFNVGNGAEDAQLFAIPGVLRGTVSDSVRTRLMSADVNLKWHSSPNLDGAHFAFLTGVRWFRLDERYLNEDTSSEDSQPK